MATVENNLRKPISRQELLHTLVMKFGAVETVRYYLADAFSDLQSMGVGISENNPMLASKHYESLQENLMMIRSLLEEKDNKPALEGEIKKNS